MFYVTRYGICCVLIIFERQRGRLGSKISDYGQMAEVAVFFHARSFRPREADANWKSRRVRREKPRRTQCEHMFFALPSNANIPCGDRRLPRSQRYVWSDIDRRKRPVLMRRSRSILTLSLVRWLIV